jgi:hypothetical protein
LKNRNAFSSFSLQVDPPLIFICASGGYQSNDFFAGFIRFRPSMNHYEDSTGYRQTHACPTIFFRGMLFIKECQY